MVASGRAIYLEGEIVAARGSRGGWWKARVLSHDAPGRRIHVRWEDWGDGAEWLPESAARQWPLYEKGEAVQVLGELGGWWRATVRWHDAEARDVHVRWRPRRDWQESDEVVPDWRVCRPVEARGQSEAATASSSGVAFRPDEEIVADTGLGFWWKACVTWHDERVKLVHVKWGERMPEESLERCEAAVPESCAYRPLVPRVPHIPVVRPPHLERFEVSVSAWGWVDDALRIFQHFGFVILRQALRPRQCWRVHDACRWAEAELRQLLPWGNRGPRRWSLAVASRTGSMLHDAAFASLLDCQPVLQVMDRLFPDGGKCTCAGGDFVAAGTQGYQRLHRDLGPIGEFDVLFPPPYVSANFVVHPIDADNGPMRILPGTQMLSRHAQRVQLSLPSAAEEPEDWLHSTLHPLEAGDVIVRDVRVLHGGTPNLSHSTRFLPSVEFALAPFWACPEHYSWPKVASMPEDVLERLSWQARAWCRDLAAPRDSIDVGWIG